jgi:hypothetical protein
MFFGAIVWAVFSTFQNTTATSMAIALIGEFAPSMIRHTVDTTEVHVCHSHRQWSLMTQMFIFLTFNAAIIMYLLTPVEDTLGAFNLQQVASVIGFSSIITPVFQFLQPNVYLWRRMQAPYASNFIKQKSFFAPKVIDLGCYFAQNNTTIFIALFYITVMPSGLMLSVVGLILRFYVDKHGLLRRWAPLPQLGANMITSSIVHMEVSGRCLSNSPLSNRRLLPPRPHSCLAR